MITDDHSREPRDEPVLERPIDPGPATEISPEDRSDTLAFEPVQRRRPKRRIGRTLIILVLFVGAGAGVWARWGDQLRLAPTDEIPVVRADAAPIKVKPDQPGGLDIPNRDKLVYDRLESLPPPRAENLLPRPEAPLLPPSARPNAPTGAPADRSAAAAPAKTAEVKTVEATTPAPPKTLKPPKTMAADNVPKIERPKPVKIAVVKKPLPPPAPPAMKTRPKVAAAPPAKPVASVRKSAAPAPPAIKMRPKVAAAPPAKPVASVRKSAAPAPPAIKLRPKVAAVPPAKPMASAPKSAASGAGSAGNGYRVQLAALRSNKDARREWTRLSTRHSGLLGRLRHSVVRADLGDKGIYYRLRAGPLENKAAARTLCGELTKIKVGCLVVRPGR